MVVHVKNTTIGFAKTIDFAVLFTCEKRAGPEAVANDQCIALKQSSDSQPRASEQRSSIIYSALSYPVRSPRTCEIYIRLRSKDERAIYPALISAKFRTIRRVTHCYTFRKIRFTLRSTSSRNVCSAAYNLYTLW
jgi:hypothetical protein